MSFSLKMMLEMDDNTLIAMSLREHAQTCEDVANKYPFGAPNRIAWQARADRCRDLAKRYESAAKVEQAAANRGQA